LKDVDGVETDVDVNEFGEGADLRGDASQLIVVQIDPGHWAHPRRADECAKYVDRFGIAQFLTATIERNHIGRAVLAAPAREKVVSGWTDDRAFHQHGK